jgi:hypothetical protein
LVRKAGIGINAACYLRLNFASSVENRVGLDVTKSKYIENEAVKYWKLIGLKANQLPN